MVFRTKHMGHLDSRGGSPCSHPEPYRFLAAQHRQFQDMEVQAAPPFHALLLPWAAFLRAGKTTTQLRGGKEVDSPFAIKQNQEEIHVEHAALDGKRFPRTTDKSLALKCSQRRHVIGMSESLNPPAAFSLGDFNYN